MKACALQMAVVMLAGVLGACAAVEPSPTPGTITYEITSQGPFCFSGCEFLKLTARPSGRVRVEQRWTNGRNTWTRHRTVMAPAAELAAFREKLQPLRPSGTLVRNGSDSCRSFTDDLPEVEVTWRDTNGEDRLRFDFGCDVETNAYMRDVLRAAPSLLGVRAPL